MNSQNVTFDNALNSTSFVFQPANCTGSGWNVMKDRGYTTCTTNSGPGPSANVTFTGIAVYYSSAFIEGNSIRFRLDGNLSGSFDLSTPSGQAVNNSATKIFWKATNLTNGVHSLQLLPGNGSSTLSVDALIVTQLDADNTTNSTSIVPGTSDVGGSSTSSVQSTSNPISSTTKYSYALGITFGILSFLVFLTILISLGRRRRDLKRFIWAKPIPPLRPNSTSFYSQGEHTGTQDQYVGSVHSPKVEPAPLPLRPLPTAPRSSGSPSTHAADQEGYDDFDMGGAPPRSWPSPAPSNRLLLSPGSVSSRGHSDNVPPSSLSRSGTATTSSTKLEPVRRVTIR